MEGTYLKGALTYVRKGEYGRTADGLKPLSLDDLERVDGGMSNEELYNTSTALLLKKYWGIMSNDELIPYLSKLASQGDALAAQDLNALQGILNNEKSDPEYYTERSKI